MSASLAGRPNFAMLCHLWKQADLDDPLWSAARKRAAAGSGGAFSLIPGSHPAAAPRGFVDRAAVWPAA